MSCAALTNEAGHQPEAEYHMCKLIVAAESPWGGEMYRTQPGIHRLYFGSVETFCSAFLALTGWPLHSPPRDTEPERPGRDCVRRRPRRRPDTKQKFIVAASAPWYGEIYPTRPGLKRFGFTTFEEFLRGVLDITGWSLDPTVAAPAVSRRAAAG
ncbi:hypothetical protein ACWDTP_03535 [Mycobacterium sp. NPDC003449]